MRAPKVPQWWFSAPLNEVLGTQASVRILRELTIADAPVTRTELAERAGLSVPGVSSAVDRLNRAGVVEMVGAGTRQSIRVCPAHPLSLALRTLFLTEAYQAAAVEDALRAVMDRISPPPRSAWIQVPEAGSPEEALDLRVLARPDHLDGVVEQLRPRVRELERRFRIGIELHGVTEADLITAPDSDRSALRAAIMVYGPHPLHLLGTGGNAGTSRGRATHRDRERLSALRSAWIAMHLDREPSLPRRARNWLVHRTHVASPREAVDLAEWIELLDGPIPRIQQVLLGSGEWPDRMRQNNPFLPVLSDREREQMKEQVGE